QIAVVRLAPAGHPAREIARTKEHVVTPDNMTTGRIQGWRATNTTRLRGRMTWKSVKRFSEKIMLQQQAKTRRRYVFIALLGLLAAAAGLALLGWHGCGLGRVGAAHIAPGIGRSLGVRNLPQGILIGLLLDGIRL